MQNVTHRQRVPEGKVFFKYGMMENETHEVLDGDKLKICFLELERFDNYLDQNSDLKEQWCWIFNNLSNFVTRPENLDPSFDDIIDESSTRKLSMKEKLAYMEARTLNERERLVIREGGYIQGFAEGKVEGAEQERKANAQALLAAGVPAETIASALGMTVEEVKWLA